MKKVIACVVIIFLIGIISAFFVTNGKIENSNSPQENTDNFDHFVVQYEKASRLFSEGSIDESLDILNGILSFQPASDLRFRILELNKPYVLVLEGHSDEELWFSALMTAINHDVPEAVWVKLIESKPDGADQEKLNWYLDAYQHIKEQRK